VVNIRTATIADAALLAGWATGRIRWSLWRSGWR